MSSIGFQALHQLLTPAERCRHPLGAYSQRSGYPMPRLPFKVQREYPGVQRRDHTLQLLDRNAATQVNPG